MQWKKYAELPHIVTEEKMVCGYEHNGRIDVIQCK